MEDEESIKNLRPLKYLLTYQLQIQPSLISTNFKQNNASQKLN
jgi:hypothetical protein